MILLRPTTIHLKSLFKKARSSWASAIRGILISSSLLFLAFVIFAVMRWVLAKVLFDSTFFTFPADILLILCFNLFIPMIFFTNLSSFIDNFFVSEDLELLLASPTSKFKFFTQKVFVSSLESSWMSLLSLMPFFFAIWFNYEKSDLAYFATPFTLILFLLVPAALASVFGLIWALILPKIPPAFLVSIIIIGICYLLGLFISLLPSYISGGSSISSDFVMSLFSKLETFGSTWSPGTWAARGLSPFFKLPKRDAAVTEMFSMDTGLFQLGYSILAGVSSVVFIASIGFLLFVNFYKPALSGMWGRRQKLLYNIGPLAHKIFKRISIPRHKQLLGLIEKESLDIFRDSTQIVQFLFLFSFFSLYLYVLQFEKSFQSAIGMNDSDIWRKILFGLNFSIESFMMVAMSLRLTFPSLSREGRGIWVLRVGPVPINRIIFSKYIVKTLPIACAMFILSFISHFIMTHEIYLSSLKASYVLVVSLSMNALAMFIGASFANFSWESRSQLIASLGSIVFMICGIIYAFFSISLSFPLNSANSDLLLPYWSLLIFANLIAVIILLKLSTRSLGKRLAVGDY